MELSESTLVPEHPTPRREMVASQLTGSQILIEILLQEKVDTLFGYPGGAVLHIYDALYHARDQIAHYRSQHEQGAIHMADGFARSTGKTGVAVVTSGPGLTNAVTGIATAYMDSAPLVVISGQVARPLIGTDAFQEVDAVGITKPCCKKNYLVLRVGDLEGILKEAFYLARHGRPGPVVVDIPKDVAAEKTGFCGTRESVPPPVSSASPLNRQMVQLAVESLLQAQRPVLYVGGGIIAAGASLELKSLAEQLEIPVTTTLMGLGAFPAGHPLYLGMLGMHGTYWANMAISEADLILAVGARFDDRVTGKVEEFGRHARIIHVDIDAGCIGKIVPADVPVVGDAKTVLTEMLKCLPASPLGKAPPEPQKPSWLSRIQSWKQTAGSSRKPPVDVILPAYLMQQISLHARPDAIFATDVGQHQMWAAQHLPVKSPRHWITSGGLGTMGFGLPAAIGAQIAHPQRQVIAIVGDGGMMMTCQELATAVRYQANVKVVIMNNRYLGMVRQWQELFYGNRYSQVEATGSVDLVKLAEAFGAKGFRTSDPLALPAVLEEGFSTPGVVVMDIRVACEENVYPMVPAGASLREMVLE